jgi:hypothetical protein
VLVELSQVLKLFFEELAALRLVVEFAVELANDVTGG